MPSTRDIDWLAGLLEGEGCFGARSQATSNRKIEGKRLYRKSARLQINMVDFDIMQRAGKLLQAKVTEFDSRKYNPRAQMQYRCVLQGRRAAAWMMTLYSLLGARRKTQIRKALAAWRSKCPVWPKNKNY